MNSLLKNIRFYLLVAAVLYSVGIFYWGITSFKSPLTQNIRIEQVFALSAITLLYLTILVSPLLFTFPELPYGNEYKKARRALGVSAFYFGLLHTLLTFFGQLGGFEGLSFLSDKYVIAISMSVTALIILFLMSATSIDFVIKKMSYPRWKFLHRFVYLAGVLILIHSLMLGTHFIDLSTSIPQILFVSIAILLGLEALRFDSYLQNKHSFMPQFGVTFVVVLGLGISYFFQSFLPSKQALSLNVHAQHIQIAKEAQQNSNSSFLSTQGITGDSTRRYRVVLDHPNVINPNEDVSLSMHVFDAVNGSEITHFKTVYEKYVHMIIVDSELKYFTHIHPEPKTTSFSVVTQFPHKGIYHIYVDFQPEGSIEQQFGFAVNVGGVDSPVISDAKPDTALTKTFGKYSVKLEYPNPLEATRMSVGEQELSFTLKDAATGKSITTLKPYLSSYGHLVMINEKTFDYIHVHPSDLNVPKPNENGGPTVKFLPLGLYGPIKPGIYHVFAQFNPDNNLFTSDFIIEIK